MRELTSGRWTRPVTLGFVVKSLISSVMAGWVSLTPFIARGGGGHGGVGAGGGGAGGGVDGRGVGGVNGRKNERRLKC